MGAMPPDMAAAMLRANPQMAGLLGGLAPGAGLPPGLALDPQQMAMFAQMQTAMTQPLSPSETLATIDELAEVGLLPPALQTELKECMVLLPQAAPALGMGMGMLAPVLPKLREARAQMLALSPSEQDEFAATMVQELQGVPAKDRKAFVDQLGGGFFPPRVVEGVKARLGAQ